MYRQQTQAVAQGTLIVTEEVSTPFGDRPVLVQSIALRNTQATPQTLVVYETAAGGLQHMDHNTAWAKEGNATNFVDTLDFAARHYNQTLIENGNTMTLQQAFLGLSNEDVVQWTAMRQAEVDRLAAGIGANPPPAFEDMPSNASMYDANPPAIFFTAVESTFVSEIAWACDYDAFFGAGGVLTPAFAMQCRNRTAGALAKDGFRGLLLARTVQGNETRCRYAQGIVSTVGSL